MYMYNWHEMMTGIMYMYIHGKNFYCIHTYNRESHKMLTYRTVCIGTLPHPHYTAFTKDSLSYRVTCKLNVASTNACK